MEKSTITISFAGKLKPVKPINNQFTLCKCYVLALGENNNHTILTKEAVDDAIPTLFNVPVVGHLYSDNNGSIAMGGHDVSIEKDEDGKYVFVPITIPYGTVPSGQEPYYEEVEENGEKKTYLVTDVILWTGRYPELLAATYSEEVYYSQSMEILALETKRIPNGLEVQKFQFAALCLLGKSDDKTKNVVPCFQSARIEPYKFTKVKDWSNELFSEFKEQLAEIYSAETVGKGGKEALNIVKEVLLEFGLAEDTVLPFEISEEMSKEELKSKIQAAFFTQEAGTDSGTKEEQETETTDVADDGTETTDFADNGNTSATAESSNGEEEEITKKEVSFQLSTYWEKYNNLKTVVEKCSVINEDTYIRYCLCDFNDEYVYCSVCKEENYHMENSHIRAPYSFENEVYTVDMSSSEPITQVWVTKEEKEKLDAKETQFKELVEYKANRIEDDRRKEFAAVLSEFSDLGDVEEYKTVVKNAMEFANVEALTEKLYAIRGKNTAKPTKKPLSEIRIPIGFEAKSEQNKYSEFMEHYLALSKK